MTEMEKLNVIALFVEEYQKGKENANNEGETKRDN